jgi:Domain of unknown function (DUF1929)/Galactose oxidase, central domain
LAVIRAALVAMVFVACQSPQTQTPVSETNLSQPPPEQASSAASKLQAQAVSSTAVQLDWTSTPEKSFNLERQSATFGIEAIGVIEGANFTDTDLTPGETYTYRLTSSNAQLESQPVRLPTSDVKPGGQLTAQAVNSVTVTPSERPKVLINRRVTLTAITNGDGANRVRWEKTGGSFTINNNKATFWSSTEGAFTVTAISLANPSKRGSITVLVQKGIVYGITLQAAPNPVAVGDTSKIAVTFDGRGTYGTGINYVITPNTASISNAGGNKYDFTATTPGTYRINATSVFNPVKTTSISINVTGLSTPSLSSLQLTANPSTVDVNQTSSLNLAFTGTGNFGRGVTWNVTPSGTVMGSGTGSGPYSFASSTPGTYAITATSTFDPSKSSSTNVTVRTITVNTGLGKWSEVISLPVPPVHGAVLPTGKVLFWEFSDNTSTTFKTKTFVWDAVNNSSITQVNNVEGRIFCSGHSLLADGRLLVVGGTIGPAANGSPLLGTKLTSYFDANALTWTRGANMNMARYYPTATILGNGDVLAISGTNDTNAQGVPTPEVWQSGSSLPENDPQRFRTLPNGQFVQGYYPMVFLGPNGNAFNLGPQKTMGWLDTSGTGNWQSVGQRNDPTGGARTYGNAVMYDTGKIVLIGGNDPPTATALTIDINASTPTITQVGSMAVTRRQHNSTVLPDGTVLVTGGTSSPGFNNPAQATLSAELWNPSSGQFRTLSSAQNPRVYHSLALLLPDGRVLSAGGSGSGAPNFPNGEIFSPPYLFNNDGSLATRPSITDAPGSVVFGSSFNVTTDSEDISRFSLIRLSSVTHSTNFDQRFLNMPFSKTGTQSSLTAPANGNLAPPGYYLLFALNAKGVPSIGKMIKLN